MKKVLTCVLLFLSTSCAHKVQTQIVAPSAPSLPAEHQVAYFEGVRAFRLATPEGYQRAVISFRKASRLERSSCDYVLHLAESLFFLAKYQQLNLEDYSDNVAEANTILQFKSVAPECNAFESYLSRLRSLSMTLSGARTVESVAMIRHAIEADPDDPLNWVVLSQLDSRPRQGESVAPSEHARELATDLPIVHYELGNYYLSAAPTYKKAKESFERALELSPRHFQSIIGVVYSLSSEGDDAANQVQTLLERAVEIAPNSLRARLLLGDHYAGMEEAEHAVEQYDAAVSVNGSYYPAHLSKGVTLVTAERSSAAEASFNAVVALDVKTPHPPFNGVDFNADAQAHYYLGNIFLERAGLVQAREEYNVAIRDIPNYAAAIYGLGIVSYREGKVDEALGHLDRVIQANPRQFPNAYLLRGGIRADRRQFPDSLRDINLAIEVYQQQAAALEAKAQSDEARGWKRRADAQRRRKALIQSTLEKAIESKKTVETLMGRGGA